MAISRPNTTSPVQPDAEAGPPTKSSAPPPLPPAEYPARQPQIRCSVDIEGDSAYAMVLIEPHILKRLQTRYPNNLEQALWDNVFKPALYGAVY